jgi:hypothetical protein
MCAEPLIGFFKRNGGIDKYTLGTADASGDLSRFGDQSGLVSAGWRASDRRLFAGSGTAPGRFTPRPALWHHAEKFGQGGRRAAVC